MMSTLTTPQPIIRAHDDGERRWFFGGGLHTWKLLAEDTDGAFFLFEDTMVRDKTTPLHLHPEAHEMTYVVDGEIEIQADGNRSRPAAEARDLRLDLDLGQLDLVADEDAQPLGDLRDRGRDVLLLSVVSGQGA